MDIKIGENLKFYRVKAGLTQEEIAKFCDKEPSEISNYETNKITPSLPILLKISLFIDVPLHTLTISDHNTIDNQLKSLDAYENLCNLNEKELSKIVNLLVHINDNQ